MHEIIYMIPHPHIRQNKNQIFPKLNHLDFSAHSCHNQNMQHYDVIIIGAGAAGLTAAAQCVSHGVRTAVLDMGRAPARKVRVSGGGRCNITNTAASRDRYFGENPDFVRGILARVTPQDILTWATEHNLGARENDPGRFFCDAGAAAVVDALAHDARGADIFYETHVHDIEHHAGIFTIKTSRDLFSGTRVIVASGGISYPNLGVSDLGYRIAKKFGHKIVPPRPGLTPIHTSVMPTELAGISLNVAIHIGRAVVSDALLLTHNGIGGPAAYRTSLYDLTGGITIDFCPDVDMNTYMTTARMANGRRTVATTLSEWMPMRLARWLAGNIADMRIADLNISQIRDIVARTHNFYIAPDTMTRASFTGAEVTFGGVDTHDISPRTLESKRCPGLYFVGEVLDITGDLGGFNLQWAWSSGRVAAMAATN